MPDRRWSDGLHQAVEAKENVAIRQNTETAASVTYQNFFLLYPKLSGMTGTAKTAEIEFEKKTVGGTENILMAAALLSAVANLVYHMVLGRLLSDDEYKLLVLALNTVMILLVGNVGATASVSAL